MGDDVFCTPAFRAIRRHFESAKITFFANSVARQILSPNIFNDSWLDQQSNNPFVIANMFRKHRFTHAILFKNSFASALTCFLAGIPSRIGYARDGRAFLLTEKLHPSKLPTGNFKPVSMVKYYLAIAAWLGADISDENMQLPLTDKENQSILTKIPEIDGSKGPVVIMVPGAVYGPSKRWIAERFAETADRLIAAYNATVIISISPTTIEKQIAEKIQNSAKNNFITTAQRNINLGELKSLLAKADLVIANDTGPRHMSIALQRKVISLLGPTDLPWIDFGYENEIPLVGQASCAPCVKPVCKLNEHLCMQSITVDMVCAAAGKLLENKR